MSGNHQVRLQPSGRCFDVRPDETILAAATRNAVWLSSRCHNGSCGQCIGRRVAGRIFHAARPSISLEPDEICLCIAKATSDVELCVEERAEPQRHLRQLPAKVMAAPGGSDGVIALKLPSMARAALFEGCRFDLKAPASHAGLLTVMSIDSQCTALVRWQSNAATSLRARLERLRGRDGADSRKVLNLTWTRHVDPDHAAAA